MVGRRDDKHVGRYGPVKVVVLGIVVEDPEDVEVLGDLVGGEGTEGCLHQDGGGGGEGFGKVDIAVWLCVCVWER